MLSELPAGSQCPGVRPLHGTAAACGPPRRVVALRLVADVGEKQGQKQIPCGNDKRESKGKGRSRFPAGMTNGKGKGKGKSRFPAGMTNRKGKGKGEGSGGSGAVGMAWGK